MADDRLTRKLTAALYADVAGYSRLTGEDEEGTHRRLSAYLDRFTDAIAEHDGRVVHYAGDAILADFETVSDALACALSVQSTLRGENEALPAKRRVEFRIGINLGEVIVDRGDIYGDGVNVAARLESLAEPGGICISEAARAAAGRKLDVGYEFLGEREVKNIAEPVRAYAVVHREAGDESAGPPACPYPGMVPFEPDDAAHFHGREGEIAQMVELLRHQRFMMVIGPSGSGKSSLVQAGLLPALAESRYFPSGFWQVRRMRPGPEPNTALARVFEVEGSAEGLDLEVVDALLAASPPAERVLLLVDQFEETFTQATREEAGRFIAALQGLRTRENLALVLTLRADFYPDLMNSYLWPVDASQRVEVAPLRGEALREAIVRPAEDTGVRIEAALLDRLLHDAADEPGVLPLLQETMRLLWHELEGRVLPVAAYERLSRDSAAHAVGAASSGLAAAIAMKADATLAALGPAEQAIARRTFLRLVQFGEGRADTRRQQTLRALRAADDEPAQFEHTLEHLTDHRLLTRSGGEVHEETVVDIAHESLITGWSRLRRWAEERREAEQTRRRLEGKAAEWIRLGRSSGGLLDEAELPEAQRWLSEADATALGFSAAVPEFVQKSRQAIEAAERHREQARERELRQAEALADEQRQRIAAQAHAAARMRRAMVGLAAVLIVAIAAGIVAWTQSRKAQSLALRESSAREVAEARRVESEQARREAERRRAEAERARLESVAQLLLIEAPRQQAALNDEAGALMARQAYLFAREGSQSLLARVDAVLRAVVGKPYFSQIVPHDNARRVALSPAHRRLAFARRGSVFVMDLTRNGAAPVKLPGYPGDAKFYIYGLAFNSDGNVLIAANSDGTVGRWDLRHPQPQLVELPGHQGGAWSASFSPDGNRLVTGSKFDDTFAVWDLSAPRAAPRVVSDPQPAPAGSGPREDMEGGVPVAFSADGATLATGSLTGTIRLWRADDLATPVASLHGHRGTLLALAFSADGRHLASSDREGAVFLWDLARPAAAPAALSAGSAATSALDFNAEGDTLASASAEGIRVWRIDDPRGAPTVIPAGFVTAVAFSRDGKRLASGGPISSYVRLWDLAPGGRPRVLSGHAGSGVQSLAFSADGTLLASGGGTGDGTIRLWRWDELDAAPRVLSGHRGTVSSLQFSADDTQLLSASWNDSAILLWDLGKSSPTHTALRVPERMLPYMARFGPDGDTVAASGRGGLHTWRRGNLDAEPELVQPFKGWATEMAYSPGGDRVALGGSRVTTIYLKSLTRPDAPARELVVRGDPSDTWSVAFSPDGQWLASGGKTDPTVRLWNLRARDAASIVLGQHDEAVTRVRFSPDGRQLASASQDYTVRLWDVGRLEATPIVLSGHEGEVWSLAYSPDGTHLVAGGRDKMIRIWDLTHPRNASPTPTIADEVCRKVWRNLTLQEWHKFVSVELPYERTCPNLPVHPSLVEAAEKKATAGDIEAAVSLYRRAVELQPELGIQPELEAARVASEAQ